MIAQKSIRFLALLPLLTSCLQDLNLDPDTNLVYQGQWAVPVINTRINLGNLANDQSWAYADPDGLVHIIYREDSLFSQSVFDYTQVPAQAPTLATAEVGLPPVTIETSLGTLAGAKLKSLAVASGNLRWKASTTHSGPLTAQLELLHTSLNGAPAVFQIGVPGAGSASGSIDIAGLNIDLTQGSPAWNNLGFKVTLINTGNTPMGTQMDLELEYEDLAIDQAVGYFGQRKINLPSGVVQTSLGVLDNLAQGLYLADPRVKLFVTTNLGLPLEISPQLIGISGGGQSVDLGLNDLSLSGALVPGQLTTDTLAVGTQNSQIANFISLVPKEILYSGSVLINPNGEGGSDNFVDQDGFMTIGAEFDLPLELSTQDLVIDRTIYNVDLGIDEAQTEFLDRLKMGFRVTNAFPLDADVTVFFQDSTGAVLDSAFVEIFDPAPVNAQGRVIGVSQGDRYLEFSKEKIKAVIDADDIRIRVVLNTPGNGGQIIRLYTENYIDLQMGVEFKMNYKLQ
jgi:hypothetical protein